MYIPDNKQLYDSFLSHKEDIENELGYSLKWRRMDDSKTSMICKYINGLNFDDHSNYKQLMNECISTILVFRKAFKKYL